MSETSGRDVLSAFDILPAIDLRGGRVVRLRQGDFARETPFSDDPVAVALEFVAAGSRWLHVVDLDGARTGRPVHGERINAIVAAVGDRAQVEIAGGLRTLDAVSIVLATGAARAVVGTAAIRDPGFAGQLVAIHGAARIVAAIDVRDGAAVGDAWAIEPSVDARVDARVDAAEAIARLADVGVTTFEVTAIERDGLLGGPDMALYERMVALDRGTIIASAGIVTVDHLRAVQDLGCGGAIVGRALYDGSLELATAIAEVRERRRPGR